MDKQFFKSKEFAIAAVIAVLAVAAGAFAAVDAFDIHRINQDGCQLDAAPGDRLDASRQATEPNRTDEGLEQTITWSLDLEGANLASVDACTDDGPIEVLPAPTDQIEVTANLHNDGENARQALEASEVRARFTQTGDGVALTVDKPQLGARETTTHHSRTRVLLTVHVPVEQVPALSVQGDDGDVEVRNVEVSSLTVNLDDGEARLENVQTGPFEATTDDGDVVGRSMSIHGDLTAATDDGHVRLRVSSIASGNWELNADDGRLGLRLPAGDEIGYDVSATSDDGSILIELHNSNKRISSDGGTANARSNDYHDRDVQVEITASADDGEIDFVSGGTGP